MLSEEIKIVLYSDKRIVIRNFKELKDINDDYILIDMYLFIGKLLKITILDEGYVEIYGKINEIKVIE
jgi:hypothetical protein